MGAVDWLKRGCASWCSDTAVILLLLQEALRKEADDNHARMLSAQAERDILHARLAKAKEAGFVEPEGQEGADGDLDMPLIEAKLAQIAKLESENRRLKQVRSWLPDSSP